MNIINANGTLINLDNVCTLKRYYQITKEPGSVDKKDYFRFYITFLSGKAESIEFDSEEQMDHLFKQIPVDVRILPMINKTI